MVMHDVIEQAQLHAARLVERHHNLLEECSNLRVKTRSELGRDADQREAGEEHINKLVAKLIEIAEAKAVCMAKEQSIMAYSRAAIDAQRMAQQVSRDEQALLASGGGGQKVLIPAPNVASKVMDARKEVMCRNILFAPQHGNFARADGDKPIMAPSPSPSRAPNPSNSAAPSFCF